jgi:hypothetical protein
MIEAVANEANVSNTKYSTFLLCMKVFKGNVTIFIVAIVFVHSCVG